MIIETKITDRPYTLRKLKDSDLFPLLSLLRSLGLKDLKEAFSKAADEASEKEIGVDVALSIADAVISNLQGEAGDAVYAFYSSLSGIPIEEMKEMEFGTLPMMVYDSISDVKNSSFFRVLSKSL